jgi:hypothetical protein
MSNGANWKPTQVISGTYGRVWWDGELVFEAKGCEASVELQMEAVKQAGQLADGQKMTGYNGTGTLRLHKVFSRALRKLSDSVRAGINPEFTLVSELNDPASRGAERVILKGVQFTTLPLANWELGALGETELPFSFNDWEPVSTIKHE